MCFLISATGVVWLILAIGTLLFILNGLTPRKASNAGNTVRTRNPPAHTYWHQYQPIEHPIYLGPEYYVRNDRFRDPRESPRFAAIELRRRALFNQHLQRTLEGQRSVKALHQMWRRSIAGLLSLAQSHLQSAKENLQLHLYENSVSKAAASVENIARALLYCYGDKPDLKSGQTEALQILAARLNDSEKSIFQEAIKNVTVINHNSIALKQLASKKLRAKLFDQPNTRKLVERADSVVSIFQRIIDTRFRLEISELTT